MQKSGKRITKGRIPLGDVTNGERNSNFGKLEAIRERFLLVREDLSKVLGEIDELLSDPLKDDLTKDESTQEIESFIKFFSDLPSSLQSWVPRLKNTIKKPQTVHKKADLGKELIVSSSPLVSWRNGASTIETERHLFLLTPLHKLPPSIPRYSGYTKIFPKSKAPEAEISPLKTGSILRSASVTALRKHRGTPWAAPKTRLMVKDDGGGDGDGGDVCSSSEGEKERTRALMSRYPELYGLELPPKPVARKKEIDDSLDWFLSPPKTCVVWDHPTDENNAMLQTSGKTELRGYEGATPAWAQTMRSTARGKTAGEATLKRELWTKFEAVTSKPLQYDHSIFQKLPRNRFLDMLEEVS